MRKLLTLFFVLFAFGLNAQDRYYKLDGNASESTNSSLNGTFGSGTSSPIPTTDRFNNPNSALSFDGDDYISIPVTGLINNEYSFAAWVYLTTAPASLRSWIAIGNPNTSNQFAALGPSPFGNGLVYSGYRVSQNNFQLYTLGVPPLNQWYHVCGVYGLDYAKFYVNGQLIDSSASNGSLPDYGLNPIAYIGSRSLGQSGWIGKIDEVKYFNHKLSAIEVANLLSPGPLSAYGKLSFCTGGDVLLAITAPSGSTYQWKKNGANISGATTYKYTSKTAGTYNCAITSSGITTLSNSVTVIVTTNPSSFTMNANGATSFCAGGSVQLSITPTGTYTYQWFRGNLQIDGETSSTYTAFNPGAYKAVVTNTQNGCGRISGAKTIAVNCRMMNPNIISGGMDDLTSPLTIYPNPAQRSFMIEINDASNINETAQLELMNYACEKVFEAEVTIENGNMQYPFNVGDKIANGFYTLIVKTDQRRYTQKVIIN